MNKCLCEGAVIYTNNLALELKGKTLTIDYSVGCRCGAFEEESEINFCPLCGRQLKDNIQEQEKDKC